MNFLNDNPGIEFHPSDYINDPAVIARHNKMVALNVAMEMDLTGQVAADALPYNPFFGCDRYARFYSWVGPVTGRKVNFDDSRRRP